MITRDKIETILLKAVKADAVLGLLPEIRKGNLKPVTESEVTERISIRCGASDNESWQHSFAYVYVYCPLIDFKDGSTTFKRENTARISVLESSLRSMFKAPKLIDDGGFIRYKMDTITSEEEKETFSTVITVKLRITNENF